MIFSIRWQIAVSCVAIVLGLASNGEAFNQLAISPSNPRQLDNSNLQFRAKLDRIDLTRAVKWTSSNHAVATIARGGLATLLSAGTTGITASLGNLHASTMLDVTTAISPVFSAQPTNTNVSAVIDAAGGLQVELLDNLGDTLPNQKVTMSIGSNPPGTGTLSGTLTRKTNASGIATFSDLKIDWLGTGYTLVASASPSSGPVSGSSASFNELRVGDACLGPDTPACLHTCADSDGDGLNDSWEIAGGVDLNGDGIITDTTHDLLLAGADPKKPDIFVQYDWMDYGMPGNACTVDSDCAGLGQGHKGETCSGPQLIPTASGSCRYACSVDSDCTSRKAFPGDTTHAEEVCRATSCAHTHDPSVVSPNALQAVVDSFAVHGINLHLIRGHAQPHSTVISFRLLSDPQFPDNIINDLCEGGSVASSNAGPGKYVESFYDLKERSSVDKLNIAYHYMIFGHYSACDTTAHCDQCVSTPASNPDGSPKAAPIAAESGLAEVSGNDFIVSLGNRVQDLGISAETLTDGGTFMHELGHNLGLHHGGGIDEPCQDDSQCRLGNTCTQTTVGKYCQFSDDTSWKPNYLSVMNYRFQFAGISSAAQVGSDRPISCSSDADCPERNYCFTRSGVCGRLDFSGQTLPTGGNTPGALEERNTGGAPGLNEPAGLGSGTADLTSFFDSQCDVPASTAATDGPIDWSGNGDTLETNVSADLNAVDHPCGTTFGCLTGATDWPELSGINFTYGFQCTPYGGPHGDARVEPPKSEHRLHQARETTTGGELSSKMAMEAHLLFPIRPAKIIIRPGCSRPAFASDSSGVFSVALFGEPTFDIRQVDKGSLMFAGARPLSLSTRDVDGDGILDLVISFDSAKLKLSRQASTGRLSGWLVDSQAFFGEDKIQVVSGLPIEDPSCR